MKKKVLLFTTIYPAPDRKFGTSTIHYFTREWVKLGYDVQVIHFQTIYPLVFYWISSLFRNLIASKTGAIVLKKRDNTDKLYKIDDVEVHRQPIFKWIPYGKYTKKEINRQLDKIIKINEGSKFIPDILIGHFPNPQLEIVSRLKETYSAKTCMVLHNDGKEIKKIYDKNYQELMNNIDVWGFRSIPFQMRFENLYGKREKKFICHSGIPEEYLTKSNREFKSQLKEFIYVGDFIKLKNVDSILYALNEGYPNRDFNITLIGAGGEEQNLRKIVKKLKLESCVKFIGKVSRKEVQSLIELSDCFIMVSAPEAFGLVYVEAMGKGCITIGSRDQGIDGVIFHGENGFLCEAGNSKELAKILIDINNMNPEKRKEISENALKTAQNLTDYKVAWNYINYLNENL